MVSQNKRRGLGKNVIKLWRRMAILLLSMLDK